MIRKVLLAIFLVAVIVIAVLLPQFISQSFKRASELSVEMVGTNFPTFETAPTLSR